MNRKLNEIVLQIYQQIHRKVLTILPDSVIMRVRIKPMIAAFGRRC